MKTKYYLLLFAAMCMIVYACRKIEFNAVADKNADAEEWLQQNGGNYKSQKMAVKLPDSFLL